MPSVLLIPTLYFRKVSWCSWLSHHLDVVRVPGSNPGETILFSFFPMPIRTRYIPIYTSIYCYIHIYAHTPRPTTIRYICVLPTFLPVSPSFISLCCRPSIPCDFSYSLPFLTYLFCLLSSSARPNLLFLFLFIVSSCSSAGSSVRLKI